MSRILLDTCIVLYLIQERATTLIIAHAITENIPLVSSDHKFDFYIKQGLKYICNS